MFHCAALKGMVGQHLHSVCDVYILNYMLLEELKFNCIQLNHPTTKPIEMSGDI